MTNDDAAIQRYYSIEPIRFPLLVRMEIQQTIRMEGQIEVTLTLELRSDNDMCQQRLVLSFAGVRDLCFQPWIAPIRFAFLQVGSITELQWEGVAYKVAESEQDTNFSFLCREFGVELHEETS